MKRKMNEPAFRDRFDLDEWKTIYYSGRGRGDVGLGCVEELLPDILEGRIEPGRVFDQTVDLEGSARWLPRDGGTKVDQGSD